MPDNRIRLLTQQDLGFAQSLRAIAGWNQTDRDWLRILEYSPEGCFLCEHDGQAVATATTVCYGNHLAWIGMVLVQPQFRRKGIATFLLEHCLDYLLHQKEVQCVKLDASPDGKEVYGKLGFQQEYELSRWAGKSSLHSSESEMHSWICNNDLDLKAFGINRQGYLKKLKEDSLTICEVDTGLGMLRNGSNKKYLGPIIAQNPETGRSLVMTLLNTSASATPIYWDIPEDNVPAVELALELKFKRERTLNRMWLGQPVPSDPTLQWAISGPETG